MKKIFLRIARVGVLVYLGLMLFLAACQNRMLYFPTRASAADLLRVAKGDGLEPWTDATGAVIGWHTGKPAAPRRIVVFHGNAGYALNRTYYTEALSRLGWDVFLFEYPGYGARDGTPGRSEFLTTGRAALEQLLAADARPLYLLGESVGSGTAAALAGELPERIAGVAMVIPFARLLEVAKWHFPYVPVGLILRDRYDNLGALEKYHGPVAVVVAERDEVVSPEQGRKLHAGYSGPKHFILLKDATHNDFPNDASADWWRELSAFLSEPRPALR